MIDDPASSEENRGKAADLYAEGCRLEALRDYAGALKCCEESLRLCDDEAVRAAYFKLLATIGPL